MLSMSKLVKAVGDPRDAVRQAVGWLAREGKVEIAEQARKRMIFLR